MAKTAVAKEPSSAGTDDSLDQVDGNTTERKPSGEASKRSLFDDDDTRSSEDDSEDGGAQLEDSSASLKINEEYARRFEHNKKREERQRLEEKYGPDAASGGKGGDEDDSESSEDETEDEAGFLATEDLDAEISATLQAIKNKDPRIYDKNSKFYKPFDETLPPTSKGAKEKPVYLQDYHRERYMKGDVGAYFDDDLKGKQKHPPQTYAQEQDAIKKSIISEINALVDYDGLEGGASDDEGFIKRKERETPGEDGLHPSRAGRIQITEADVANADKDPELFLSNFMASRAWAPTEGTQWQAFESDEGEEDNMAEEFENAYNMRFEDPEKSNEVLKSYSRTLVAARSVRREEKKGRKRQRELEKERKEAEKQGRKEERARLRRLKIEETEEKLKKIRAAAGLSGKSLDEDEWAKLLEDAWENDKWEDEMRKKFGDQYYAEEDVADSSDEEGGSSKKRKPKKPKWDDDIDIKDIVPDFDDSVPPNMSLTDSGGEDDADGGINEHSEADEDEEDEDENSSKKRKTAKSHRKDHVEVKRAARKDRARIEALVDTQMELDDPTALASSCSSKKKIKEGATSSGPAFRYRETSPNSFGLTARDILLAPSDAALNEFVGLKKLATFRDPEKKQKDKKRLGKKARLRQWRRDNFGKEYEHMGPTFGFEAVADADGAVDSKGRGEKEDKRGKAQEEGREKSRKRKRSKSKKFAT